MRNGHYNKITIQNILLQQSNFFKTAKKNFAKWPPQNPEINPIENLWNILDTEIPLKKKQY